MHRIASPGRPVAWRIIGFAFAGCVGLTISSVSAGAADHMPVTVVVARQGLVAEQVNVVGTLSAREEIQVHPSIEGREITEILIEARPSREKDRCPLGRGACFEYRFTTIGRAN